MSPLHENVTVNQVLGAGTAMRTPRSTFFCQAGGRRKLGVPVSPLGAEVGADLPG